MYKLFIVDDEPDALEGIATMVDWRSIDVEICGVATNGYEALELVDSLRPDLFLIDINMPLMNGLEFLDRLQKKDFPFQSIILSGYDEFTYAQKAMSFGAADYLLKPCLPEDILAAVRRAKRRAETRQAQEELFQRYERQFYESLPQLQERLLMQLLAGPTAADDLEEKLALYQLSPAGGPIRVILFQTGAAGNQLPMERETIGLACRDMADALLQHAGVKAWTLWYDNCVVAVCPVGAEITRELRELLEREYGKLTDELGVPLSVAVSAEAPGFRGLWKCYRECRAWVDTRHFLGENRVSFYDQDAEPPAATLYPAELEQSVISSVRLGDADTLNSALNDYYAKAASSCASKTYLQQLSVILAGNIYKDFLGGYFEPDPEMPDVGGVFARILASENLPELQGIVCNFAQDIAKQLHSINIDNRLIQAALEYIRAHYAEVIRLETVAQNIYISPGYLSALFKKVVGMNFVEYWHSYRIRVAQGLLDDLSLKVYEVASQVGYRDEKYFSQIFKKFAGVSPRQYRENLNNRF